MISSISIPVVSITQLLGYAMTFIWALVCSWVKLAARLLTAESQLAECKRRIIQKQAPKPRFTLWRLLSEFIEEDYLAGVFHRLMPNASL
ncbi:hypothetical protein ACFL41_01415 [Gemmatimonadota bacterium]